MRVAMYTLLLGAIAAVVLLARQGHRAAAPPPPVFDPFEAACRNAREEQCDVLVWWRRGGLQQEVAEGGDAFEREVLGDDTRAFGFVVLEYRGAEDRVSSLPAPLQPLLWWCPGLGSSSHDDARTRPMPTAPPLGVDFSRVGLLSSPFVLLDAGGRPIELLRAHRAGEARQFVDDVVRARAIRERRDAAFVRARETTGAERAAQLRAALQVLDRWIVVRCYADELAEAAANGDAEVRAWAEPLVHESRVLLGCDAIGRACASDLATIDPRRLRVLLSEAAAQWQDVPEVLQLAACCQATADLRWAGDDAARDQIAQQLEDAIELAPASWVAQLAVVMRLALAR